MGSEGEGNKGAGDPLTGPQSEFKLSGRGGLEHGVDQEESKRI